MDGGARVLGLDLGLDGDELGGLGETSHTSSAAWASRRAQAAPMAPEPPTTSLAAQAYLVVDMGDAEPTDRLVAAHGAPKRCSCCRW